MQAKTIRTLKAHPKGGKIRAVGEIYDAPAKFADLMVKIGKAEYAQHPVRQIAASEAVKKEAAERDIDLSVVQGSGKDGRIVKRDLQNYLTRMMQAG